MAEAAVTFLLEQVKEVVIGYSNLIAGAETDFENLGNDLKSLKAFLKMTEETKSRDPMLKELVIRIRKVVYEVEDTIDFCLNKAIEIERFLVCKPVLFCTSKFSLAKQVKSIRDSKVQQLFADQTYMKYIAEQPGNQEHPYVDSQRDNPIRGSHLVVGFHSDERKIMEYINEDTDKLNVISIVGIPGQGKTTFAWKIYCNDNIVENFPIRIWVNVSEKFDMKNVLLQILKSFSWENTSNKDTSKDTANANDLAVIVRLYLEKVKFLLVLDDVWSVGDWNKIKEALPENNGLGKVLITTREGGFRTNSRAHNLTLLSPDERRALLWHEVFDKINEHSSDLLQIGHEIAIKCDGVPLMIVVIGGILLDQLAKSKSTAVDKWKMVADHMSVAVQNDEQRLIEKVVDLSYRSLSDELKECFLFLGVFPEDYEIPAKMLFRLWIAEGFILKKDEKSLEESAEDNMNDLICRNLLKAGKINEMGKVKTCRVHDIIRAFCIAKSKQDNLFQEVKLSTNGECQPQTSVVENSHRLCFSSDLSTFLSKNPSGRHVRSFLCFHHNEAELKSEYVSVIPDGFTKLRIMECARITFDKFPLKLTKLIHLRYLTLYIYILTDLPEAITRLWNLQMLVVETQSRTITVKADLWRLIRLRYLKTKAVFVLDTSKWTGNAAEMLHTLNRLAPESCTEAVSKKAKNLRTLGISGKLTNIFESNFLQNLHHLVKLKLVNKYEPTPEDFLHRLPDRKCFPPNLKRLTLTYTCLNWSEMSMLATIRSLEVLKLRDDAFKGALWDSSHVKFPSLRLLVIEKNKGLVTWKASDYSFPELKTLVVRDCKYLMEIPESLGTNLENLEIAYVRCSAVVSAEKICEKIENSRSNRKSSVQFSLIKGPGCSYDQV